MSQQTGIRVEALATISTPPQFGRTMSGRALCAFKVTVDGHPMMPTLEKLVHVWGDPTLPPSEDLPVKINEKLGVGCLVRVSGTERQRQRKVRGVEFLEGVILAEEVGLRAYAEAGHEPRPAIREA